MTPHHEPMTDDEFAAGLRNLQCHVLAAHEQTVDVLAAAQSADFASMTPEQIRELVIRIAQTARSNIVALMTAAHLLDVAADVFQTLRSNPQIDDDSDKWKSR